jgi:hypothetical protein
VSTSDVTGRRVPTTPDIVLLEPPVAAGPPPLPIAVEVELTMKSTEQLTAICRAFARSRHIQGVIYFAETTKLKERLLHTVEQVHGEEMIVVLPLSAVVESLPGFEIAA